LSIKVNNINELLTIIKDLRPIKCDLKGFDYPCILCLECPKANYKEYKIDGRPEIFLKKTVNSAILSVKIPTRDELDKLLVREIGKALKRKWTLILDPPEDGYDFSLLIKATDVSSPIVFNTIAKFLKEFVRNIMQALTEARSLIKRWAESQVEKFQS